MENIISFNESIILDSINESIIYLSPVLKDHLLSMDNNIADKLLDMEYKDANIDYSFIDIDDVEKGLVSFIKQTNVDKARSDSEIDLSSELWGGKSRNSIKIGKLVRRLFPVIKDTEIEKFVNIFKSKSNTGADIKLVSGDEIRHWYDAKNNLYQRGSLGSSCMNNGENKNKNIFDIYVNNPDVCKLLIMTINGKLIARALVWKLNTIKGETNRDEILNEKPVYFMDRVYSINDYDEIKLKKYADSKGWVYRSDYSYDRYYIAYYKSKKYYVDLTVKVKKGIINHILIWTHSKDMTIKQGYYIMILMMSEDIF